MARTKQSRKNVRRGEQPGPHDGLFQLAFSDPRHAASELQCVFPRELVERIRWETLRRKPDKFVDAKLTSRYSDVLFVVELDGKDAFIYVLLEHNCARQVGQGFVPPKLTMTLWAEGPTPHAV